MSKKLETALRYAKRIKLICMAVGVPIVAIGLGLSAASVYGGGDTPLELIAIALFGGWGLVIAALAANLAQYEIAMRLSGYPLMGKRELWTAVGICAVIGAAGLVFTLKAPPGAAVGYTRMAVAGPACILVIFAEQARRKRLNAKYAAREASEKGAPK